MKISSSRQGVSPSPTVVPRTSSTSSSIHTKKTNNNNTSSNGSSSSSSLARASKSGISWEVRQVNTSVSSSYHHRTNSTPHKTASQLVIKRLLERMTEERERSIVTTNTADTSFTDTSMEHSPNMDDSLEMNQPPLVSRSGTNNSSGSSNNNSTTGDNNNDTNNSSLTGPTATVTVSSSDEETPAVFARGGGITITTVSTSHHPRTPGRNTSTFERASPTVSRTHTNRGSPIRTSSSTNPVPIGSANRSNTIEKNVILDDRPAPVLLLLSQLEQGGLSWGDWMLDDDKINARMGNPSSEDNNNTILKLSGNTTMNRTPSRTVNSSKGTTNDYEGPDSHSSSVSNGENGTFGFTQSSSTTTTVKPVFSWFSRRDNNNNNAVSTQNNSSTNASSSSSSSTVPPNSGKTLHQKLSSPERLRPSPQETAIRSVQRQAAAEAKRQTLQEEKMNKLMEQNARVRDANQRVQARHAEVASSVAEKLEAAEARHNQVLRSTRQRAENEIAKVSEARISQRAEIENRKASMQLQMEEADRRRNQVLQQRLARVSGYSPKLAEKCTNASNTATVPTATSNGSTIVSRPRDSTISYASAVHGGITSIPLEELENDLIPGGKDTTTEPVYGETETVGKNTNLSILFVPVSNDNTAPVNTKNKKRNNNNKEEKRSKEKGPKRAENSNASVAVPTVTLETSKPNGPVTIPTAPTVNPWKKTGSSTVNEPTMLLPSSTKPTKDAATKVAKPATIETSKPKTHPTSGKSITPPESPTTNTNPWETVTRVNTKRAVNSNGGTKKNSYQSAQPSEVSSVHPSSIPSNKVVSDRVGTPLPGVGNGAVNTKSGKLVVNSIVGGTDKKNPIVTVPVIETTTVNRLEIVSNENDLSPPVSPTVKSKTSMEDKPKPKEVVIAPVAVSIPPAIAIKEGSATAKISKKNVIEKPKDEPLHVIEVAGKEGTNNNNGSSSKLSAAKKKKLRKLRSTILSAGIAYGAGINISLPVFPDNGNGSNPLSRTVLTLRKLLTVDEKESDTPSASIENDNAEESSTNNGISSLTCITSDIENAVKENWRILEGKPLTTGTKTGSVNGNNNKTNDTSYSDPLLVGMAKMHMSTLLLSTINNNASNPSLSSTPNTDNTPTSSSISSPVPLFRFADNVSSSSSSGPSNSSIPLPITSIDADIIRKSQFIHLLSRCVSKDTLLTNPRTVAYAIRTIGLACTVRENRDLALAKGLAIPIIDTITAILNDLGTRLMDRHPRTVNTSTTKDGKATNVPIPASAVPRFDSLVSPNDVTDAYVSILLAALEALWLLLRHDHSDINPTLSITANVPTKLSTTLVQVESSIVMYILGSGIIQQMGDMFRLVRELPTNSQIAYTPLLQASLAVLINICNRSTIDITIEDSEHYPVYGKINSTHPSYTLPYRESLIHALCDTGSGLLDIPSLIISLVATCVPVTDPPVSSSTTPTVSNTRLDPVVLTTATLALQAMNYAARLDLVSIQTAFNNTKIIPEIRYALDLLLSHLSSTVMNSPSLVPVTDALVHELVLLVGYLTYNNSPIQDCLHYGANPPTLLHRLCNLPFRFFREPIHVSILIPSLLCAIDNNDTNKGLLLKEMSISTITDFIDHEQQQTTTNTNNSNNNLPSFIRLANRIPRERWNAIVTYLKQ